MSNIGKRLIKLAPNVKVLQNSPHITVSGPHGELSYKFDNYTSLQFKSNWVQLYHPNSLKWGTYHAVLRNLIQGVTKGYKILLNIFGIGYRFSLISPNILSIKVGRSYDVKYQIPSKVSVKIIKPTLIELFSNDNLLLTKTATDIRSFKQPEPYKGKGIRRINEKIQRKVGKKK